MSRDFRLAVFDFDGTLVDSMERFADKAADLLEEHYGVPWSRGRALYLETSGFPFHQQLERLFPSDFRNPTVARLFERWKTTLPSEEVGLKEGAVDALLQLLGMGVEVAISSNNGQDNIDRLVQEWELPLSAALGYRGNGFSKGREHFDWLSARLGVSRAQMVFIGDSLNDLRIARQCGVAFVAATTTFPAGAFREIDPQVECIAELAAVVRFFATRVSASL